MKRKMHWVRSVMLRSAVIGLALPAAAAMGQSPAAGVQGAAEPKPRWPARQNTGPIALMISPAPQARPALQYALLPPPEETQKGNAAVKYLTATQEMPAFTSEESDLLSAAYRDAPLAELSETDPKIKALRGKYGGSSGSPLRYWLRDGSRMDGVDWETKLRSNGALALLPSMGKFRTLAQMLALEIRFDIKRHDWAAADDKLKTGYMLAKHLGAGETLIESLVGEAIEGVMNRCVEDWVAEPGSPNVYWPLTNVPTPIVDFRRAMSFEYGMAYFSMPEMTEMKAGHYSAAEWTQTWAHLQELQGAVNSLPGENNPSDWKQDLAGPGLGVWLYPQAKAYLVQKGTAADAVEKMPVPEALERYFVESFDEARDEEFKWIGLPAYQAAVGMPQWEKEFSDEGNSANFLARIMLPSLAKATIIIARGDRQIGMLRIIEAMRVYAAANGKFPAKLEDMQLPVAVDPTTGNAYQYTLNGDTATLESVGAQKGDGMRYDLRLRPSISLPGQ